MIEWVDYFHEEPLIHGVYFAKVNGVKKLIRWNEFEKESHGADECLWLREPWNTNHPTAIPDAAYKFTRNYEPKAESNKKPSADLSRYILFSTHQKEVDILKQKIAELLNKIDILKKAEKDITEGQMRSTEVVEHLKSKNKTISGLKDKILSLEKDIEIKEQQVSNYKAVIESLNSEAESVKKQLSRKWEDDSGNATKRVELMKTEIDDLKRIISTANIEEEIKPELEHEQMSAIIDAATQLNSVVTQIQNIALSLTEKVHAGEAYLHQQRMEVKSQIIHAQKRYASGLDKSRLSINAVLCKVTNLINVRVLFPDINVVDEISDQLKKELIDIYGNEGFNWIEGKIKTRAYNRSLRKRKIGERIKPSYHSD